MTDTGELERLLPCPFCGGPAEIWRAAVQPSERPAWIACMGRCAVLVTRQAQTDEEVIALWNTRAALEGKG